MDNDAHRVLKWLHIVAMAYCLGGEWGVFNASRQVVNPALSLDERRRHMETAYRIDILPRTGIIFLLPLGLHMGWNLGVQPLGGVWLIGMWVFMVGWFALLMAAFVARGTDLGLRLTKLDEGIRYVLIPVLAATGIYSLLRGYPFEADWYATKAALFAGLLIIGLLLRYIMRDWVTLFRRIAAEGSTPAVEAKLTGALATGRRLAYLYWAGIITMAFLGTVKPF